MMFDIFKKKSQPTPPQFSARDFLFGDMPLSAWPNSSDKQVHEPWQSFVVAREQLNAGNTAEAISVLRRIVRMPNLESRHYLQAWHFLRGFGETPTGNEAKRLYGVVVEVGLKNGLDMLAAYTNGTARYFNHTGAAIIWERPDDSLDSTIEALLHLGQRVLNEIGPWEEPRPPEPPEGDVRINLLAPAGLHFGQGAFGVLERDSMGGPLIVGATQLMQEMIAKSEKRA